MRVAKLGRVSSILDLIFRNFWLLLVIEFAVLVTLIDSIRLNIFSFIIVMRELTWTMALVHLSI